MSWNLNVRTKSSGTHAIGYDTEDEARQALTRAAEQVEHGPGGLATIEGQIVVPRAEVLALTVTEAGSLLV
jgi:hypothetical protein